jgi:hypothetical protein
VLERDPIIQLSIPLLNSTTRKLIADTIILLTRDDHDQFLQVLNKLSNLVPYEQGEPSQYHHFTRYFKLTFEKCLTPSITVSISIDQSQYGLLPAMLVCATFQTLAI